MGIDLWFPVDFPTNRANGASGFRDVSYAEVPKATFKEMERAAQRLTQSIGYIGASDCYGHGIGFFGGGMGELMIEIYCNIIIENP